jgi:hypothetical protein
MLALVTIFPAKKCLADSGGEAKAAEQKKPEPAQEKPKEEQKPSVTLRFFGGYYHKPETSPFVGIGVQANQSFGPLNLDALFELAAVAPEKIVLENAALTATVPLAPASSRMSKISPTLSAYGYRERDYGVDIGAGAMLGVGPFPAGNKKVGPCAIGTEVVWPGPLSINYAQCGFSAFSDRFTIKPMFVYARALKGEGDYFGGRLSLAVRLTKYWTAEGTTFLLANPSGKTGEELTMASWRVGLAATF